MFICHWHFSLRVAIFYLFSKDAHRCIHYNHGHTVAIGSLDRKIRLVDTATGNCFNHVSGHTGSIKCVHLDEKNNHLISGGFDLTVRYVFIVS